MDRKAVLHLCVDHEVPAGAINSIADIFEDPHFKAREDMISVAVPGLGNVIVPGVFPKLSKTPEKSRRSGLCWEVQTKQSIDDELGFSAAELKELKRKVA